MDRAGVALAPGRCHNRRGWRLDKPSLDQPNDSIIAIAMCMALEAMENQPEPVEVIGWAMTRCLNCGRRCEGSRCPTCARHHDNWQARRRIRDGWTWGEIRARVHERDEVCVRRGSRRRLQVHHRIALSDGGTNELANLELLCAHCHR